MKKAYVVVLMFGILAVLFSFYLMVVTFSYRDGSMVIASKVYSDFANHVPLIRSFSLGDNIPPHHPLFPGQPIRYHFLYYFFVGLLEKSGLRIDWALNIPSALGLCALLVMIYGVSYRFFSSIKVSLLSCIFFVFNGTFSFVYFFQKHPLSWHSLLDIVHGRDFPSFHPYGPGLVSAFWNLNIYVNQRHLALAFALSLFIIWVIIKPLISDTPSRRWYPYALGTLLGLSFFLHTQVFLTTVIVLVTLLLLYPKGWKSMGIVLGIAALLALPQYLYLQSSPSVFHTTFKPGYLIADNLTLFTFMQYWFMNVGLHTVLIGAGFILAPWSVKKILLAMIPVFVVGNLFQFTPEMAANHKFFNYVMLIGSMFSAYALVWLWHQHIVLKIGAVVVIVLVTLSGVIDLFPILNDTKEIVKDYPSDSDVQWIMDNTDRTATFLNTNFLFDTASISGRNIFQGWLYFTWSAGYDAWGRQAQVAEVLKANDPQKLCAFMQTNHLDYFSVTKPTQYFPVDPEFWKQQRVPVYTSDHSNLTIYSKESVCGG